MKKTLLKLKFKIFAAIAVIFSAALYIHAWQNKKPYPAVYVNGQINQQILEVAKITKKPSDSLPTTTDLVGWNAYLQQHFLRPVWMDHSDLMYVQLDPKHSQLEPLFVKLGMVDDIKPKRKKYDVLFVFGGTPEWTFQRFKFLRENIRQKLINVSGNAEIFYINGHRQLPEVEVEEAKNLGLDCEYQAQCAQLIWNEYFQQLPLKLNVITATPPEGRRANTDDTLKLFFTMLPQTKQNLLGYSNAPYVPYQADTALAVAIREKKTNLNIEVVGAGIENKKVPTVVYLDSLARRVYTFVALSVEQRDRFEDLH